MDSAVDIIKALSDGKYRLNEHTLESIVSKALICDDFALISVIGQKASGKSVFMNCLVNYLECEDKNNWPKDCVLSNKLNAFKTNYDSRPVLQLWSKPFILEANGHKTAVFLMNSNNIFGYSHNFWAPKVVEDMIEVIFMTSSTVVLNCFKWMFLEFPEFIDLIKRVFTSVKDIDSFQELFYLVRDWDPTSRVNEYQFGLECDQTYIEGKTGSNEITKYFKNIVCYLIRNPENHIHEKDIIFNNLNNEFNIQMSQLFKYRLMNIDVMQIKRHPITGRCLKPQELNQFFKCFVNKLNGESIHNFRSIFKAIDSNEDIDHSVYTQTTPTISTQWRDSKSLLIDLTEDSNDVLQVINQNAFSNPVSQITFYGDIRSESESVKSAKYQCAIPSYMNSDNDSIEMIEIDGEVDPYEVEMIDLQSDEFNETNDNRLENIFQSNNTEPSTSEEKMNFCCDDFLKCCQKLCTEFKRKIRHHIHSNDANLVNGFQSIFRIEKERILDEFHKELRHKPKNIRNKFRELFIEKIDYLIPELEAEAKQLLSKVEEEYTKYLDESIIVYENRMINQIEKEFNLNFHKSDLDKVNTICKNSALNAFKEKVNRIHNKSLTQKYLSNLRSALNSRESKYQTILNIVCNYIKEWEKVFKTDIYFEDSELYGKHNIFKQKFKSSETQNLNQMTSKLMDKVFKQIETQNIRIRDKEKELLLTIIDSIAKKFWKIFNSKLRSGFFSRSDVQKMFDKLLDYTIKTGNTICDFKEHQKDINLKFNEKLRTTLLKNISKISSDYSKTTTENKSLIERALRESIDTYINQMEKCLTQKTSIRIKDFKSIASNKREESLKHNERLLKQIQSNYEKDFFNSLLSVNINKITDQIKAHEQKLFDKYVKDNESNSMSFALYFGRQYLSAAIYDTEYRPVLGKNANKLRPNCIAFSDEMLFGYEARSYIESVRNDVLNSDFDIKNLISKKRSQLKEQLNSYPFEFSDNSELKVKVHNKIKYEFSIESMIALQVLDIKSDAEKQFGNITTNTVFTVPTHYSIRKRNAFKDVAAIAGLESVHILSEITAAAIGYSHELKPQTEIIVLFVAINDFKCDAAVCRLNGNKIEYLCYFSENLLSFNGNVWKILKIFQTEPKQNEKIQKSIRKLLKNVFNNRNYTKERIHEIVLIGASLVLLELKAFLSQYFDGKPIVDCTESDIVIKGSVIFCKWINENDCDLYSNIREVAFRELKYYYEDRTGHFAPKNIVAQNSVLEYQKTINLLAIFRNEIPVNIRIIDKDTIVAHYQIETLPEEYLSKLYSSKWTHRLIFDFDNLGELQISSFLVVNFGKHSLKNSLTEVKIGLSEEDLKREKSCVESIYELYKNKNNIVEENLKQSNSKKELQDLCLDIKKRLQNNTALGRLKRKKVEELVTKTERLFTSNGTELKTYANQKSLLEEMIITLKI